MEQTVTETRPDVVILMTDQERAAPPYETDELAAWRAEALPGRRWFEEHGVSFARHYTGSLACVPSRPTIFTGHYPDTHGVTQTDGGGKTVDDARMRWLRAGEVPTLGHWFRAAGYDTHYDGKWHISHADLHGPDGNPLATNDAEGRVDPAAVQAYLDADPLDPYGFSGWVGPEPHGARASDSGLVRDPLIADRVVAWLEDRYARRRSGDVEAQRPFLLVASFVNPHDICLVAGWAALGWPLEPSPLDPPPVPPAPTAHEDLSTKPRAQAAYRESFWSCFAPATVTRTLYQRNAQRERDLYLRLHAEVDGPLDRVRRTVVEGSRAAVLVRTSDHGELLGAHGGLRQKWFTLYDEATRVPFVIARTGSRPTEPRVVEAPTSHVDIVPTLLAAAGVDTDAVAAQLAETFTEVHPLPGRNLLPVVDGEAPDEDRAVYLQTKDNVMEGDSGVPVVGRVLGSGGCHHRCASRCPRASGPASRASSHASTPPVSDTGGSWSASSTIPPPGPTPAAVTCTPSGRWGRRPGRRRSPTSGSSTTSMPTVPRPTTVGATRPSPTCRPSSWPASTRSGADRCPDATDRGPSPRAERAGSGWARFLARAGSWTSSATGSPADRPRRIAPPAGRWWRARCSVSSWPWPGSATSPNQREAFQAQVPAWVPIDEDLVVVASGVVEIFLGALLLALLVPALARHRVMVGLVVALFFVAIFPGNVGQWLERQDAFGLDTDAKRLGRLFFQPVLVAWALWSTGAWRAITQLRHERSRPTVDGDRLWICFQREAGDGGLGPLGDAGLVRDPLDPEIRWGGCKPWSGRTPHGRGVAGELPAIPTQIRRGER
jgi:arylsulfatase A-like enzyme/uncharacterized membrane protein